MKGKNEMTFAEMCKLDGRLLALYQETQKIGRRQKTNPDKTYCRVQTFHALPRLRGLIGLKYLLCQVVGFRARVEALSTAESYDIAYQKILQTLPPCAKGKRCDCKVDFAIPALTPEELRRIDAGTLVVLKRDPNYRPPVAPPDGIDQMVEECLA
jgi:hypothetical protein